MRTKPSLLKETFPGLANLIFIRELRRVLSDCRTILDIGCGSSSPTRFLDAHTVGIDAHEKTLEVARAANTHGSFELLDARDIAGRFSAGSFDGVVALDLIEHLDRTDGLNLVQVMSDLATTKVVIFTPNGYQPQQGQGDDLQGHKSGWNVDDFRLMGFEVIGIGGPKDWRGSYHKLVRKPKIFWAGMGTLMHFLSTRRHPERAAALLAVKDVG